MASRKKRVAAAKVGRQGHGRPPLDEVERSRILEATTAVFLDKGFERASTSEIARRARASKQTLYSLFPTKADMFVGVISAHTDRLFAHYVEFVESDRAPVETLGEMGTMIASMFADQQFLALYRILVAQADRFPELARRLWSACAERGYRLLAEYLRSRRIGGPAYRKSAEQFVSLVLGDLILNWQLKPGARPSRRALRRRAREAAEDFLRLHPMAEGRKQR